MLWPRGSVKITCGKSLLSKRPAAKQYTLRLRPFTSDASESAVGFSHDMTDLHDDLASIKAATRASSLFFFVITYIQAYPGLVIAHIEDSDEIPRQDKFYASNKDKFPGLPSFASVTNGTAKPIVDTSSTNSNTRALILDDQNLINVEDPSMVLLMKLKYVNSMSNMYVKYRNKGFAELKIHHVRGLWIWIQFPSSSSTDNFQTNASLKSGSNSYKKVVDMFGKFMFFEPEESTEMSLGTWNINIADDTLDSSDNIYVNGMEKVEDSVNENSLADLNDLDDLKETINELASNKIQHPISKENIDQEDDINKVSPEIGVSGPNVGLKGCLISMWDLNSFNKDDIWCDDAFIIVKWQWRNTVGDCYMINVYGPQDSLAKAILWKRIGDFMHQHAGKYIIIRDMNVVHNENEINGSLFSRQDADNLNSFIENSVLIDLPLGGRLFTWMNKARTKLSKHNRFLISDEVAQSLPDVRVTAIDRLWSDHNTILLHVSKSNFGPSPFKLFYS
ncbi:RNA-directed DNA polymerase, eukaryota, reverse transcriptase zinc-binding domain protein, partial [Tanacetum coccineum]